MKSILKTIISFDFYHLPTSTVLFFSNFLSFDSRVFIFFAFLFRLTTEAATGGVFFKKGALRNLAKFTGKNLCQSLFFNKVAGLRGSDTGVFL